MLMFLALLAQCFALCWLLTILISGLISSRHGAPYVPMQRKNLSDLLKFGGLSPEDVFYDLGAGDGRVLLFAANNFRVKRAVGYEAAPWPYVRSRWLIRRSGLRNVSVIRKDLLGADLTEATFIYMYLFPKLVDRLAGKLALELQPGTKVLCPDFPIDLDRHPEFSLKKERKIGTMTAYLYEKR